MTPLSHRPPRPGRRVRRAALLTAVGLVIWSLDVSAFTVIATLLRAPAAAIVLNCLAGIALSAVTLHPSSPQLNQRLQQAVTRNPWGQALMCWVHAADQPAGDAPDGAKR